ncbi:MAG: hypothetical protein ACPGYL_05420 [Rhodospirillaceae bacterium]
MANDYGFVGVGAGETQQAGFFVDDQDRILYWPDKSGPGLVFDTDTGLRFVRSSKKLSGYLLTALLLLGLSVPTTIFFAEYALYQHVEAWISWWCLLFAAFMGSISVPSFVWAGVGPRVVFGLLRNKWQPQAIGILQSRRPDPVLIDPYVGLNHHNHVFGWVVIACVIVVCPVIALYSADKPGDHVALWVISGGLAWLMLRRFRKSPNWVSVLEIKTLIPLSDGVKASVAQSPKTVGQSVTRTVKVVGIKLSEFLIVTVGAFIFGGLIAFAFYEIREEKMAPETLVEAYIQSVFTTDSHQIQKWTKPVTLCVGPYDNRPRARVARRQETLWEVSGLEVTFADTHCSVDILFLTQTRSPNGEGNPPMGSKIHSVGEQLDRIAIEISVEDYGYLEPGAEFRDRYEVGDMERTIADRAALWALGIPGLYAFDGVLADSAGERVEGLELIVQMHYHSSIPHGATLEQVRPLLLGIAEELLNSGAEDAEAQSQ